MEPIETSAFVVELGGPWAAEAITLRFDLAPFEPPADAADLIERTFEERSRAARASGGKLFNGRLARLVEASAQAGRLQLTLQPTDFKTFLTTNLAAADRFVAAGRADALGLSALLLTADRQLLLGRRSERVAYNRGRLHTFGGVVEWSRPADGDSAGGDWLFDQLAKELHEELDVAPGEVSAFTAMALARDRQVCQPELLCEARVALSAAAVAERWRRAGDGEHVELWRRPAEPAALAEAVAAAPADFSPIARAAVLAHMAIRHGPAATAAFDSASRDE